MSQPASEIIAHQPLNDACIGRIIMVRWRRRALGQFDPHTAAALGVGNLPEWLPIQGLKHGQRNKNKGMADGVRGSLGCPGPRPRDIITPRVEPLDNLLQAIRPLVMLFRGRRSLSIKNGGGVKTEQDCIDSAIDRRIPGHELCNGYRPGLKRQDPGQERLIAFLGEALDEKSCGDVIIDVLDIHRPGVH